MRQYHQTIKHMGTLLMPSLRRLLFTVCLAAIALVGMVRVAQTHPHAWIDLQSTVKLDERGQIVALVVDWTFGVYYTAFILEGVLDAGTPLAETLDAVARENLTNLREFDYFTTLKADGEKQKLADVQSFETAVRDNRLWMRFEIPLATPVDPKAHTVTYAVYDPAYYIEILYVEQGERVAIAAPSTKTAPCTAEIIAPTPSAEVIGFAASLDTTQSGGASLGEQFAETVKLSCK